MNSPVLDASWLKGKRRATFSLTIEEGFAKTSAPKQQEAREVIFSRIETKPGSANPTKPRK